MVVFVGIGLTMLIGQHGVELNGLNRRKLAENPVLREIVEEKLSEWWSPQQVVLWLQRTYPDDQEMRVSHETIYLSLFVQGQRCVTQGVNRMFTHRAGIPATQDQTSPFRQRQDC